MIIAIMTVTINDKIHRSEQIIDLESHTEDKRVLHDQKKLFTHQD